MINADVAALRKALDAVQEKLMAASVRAPGFAEMHAIYWSLSEELIRVGNESTDVIRKRLEDTATKITAEWESSKKALEPWNEALKLVVDALGLVLGGGLNNPLGILLAAAV